MSILTFPIAIVGLACRLPGGVASLDDLWALLCAGRDAVTQIPADRWSVQRFFHARRAMAGRCVTKSAGIIENIYDFDAEFFGISRTEAEAMDPQQRLMLELAWEAFEDARLFPAALAGSRTAVYVGAASPDAGTSHADDMCATSPYSMTGTNLSIISNRISYIFDLHGPSMTIDTACSSSMHALHQACQTLASGGADRALAGGVNVLLSPYPFVGFSQAHMLSADGRCKVFDATGNGYVRAEGGGLLLLQPLDAALAQGRRIHGVIRAVGLNSDGRTQGIALPNGAAQESLLRAVYGAADVDLDNMAYMEAHGTGTAVGDPIEMGAIGRALGAGRARPLLTGSVKCHVGHLETASAMAGIFKALLVLRQRRVPPQIHIRKLNPAIDFAGLGLRVPLRMAVLPRTPGLPLAGVNSFGFGGANGHALLEAAPTSPRRRVRASGAFRLPQAVPSAPFFLSARSEASLRQLAGLCARRLEEAPESFAALAAGMARCREVQPHRLAVTGADAATVAQALRAVEERVDAEQGHAPVMGECLGVFRGRPSANSAAGVAFVYSGNGSQWAGMGKTLLHGDAVFARAVREVSALLLPLCGRDMAGLLDAGVTPELLALTEVAQPLLFMVQVGLTEALRARGLHPDMVWGHSVGEVAAAWACGALSLPDAALVIHHRSSQQGRTRGMGRMAAVNLSPEEAQALPAALAGLLEVAGVNTPGSVTLAGDADILRELEQELHERNIFFRMLPLDYAFHSRSMDGIEEPLCAALRGLRPRRGRIPFISTVTGGRLDGRRLDAHYWWRNVRCPVLFAQATACALEAGARLALEVGPHPVLQHYVRDGLRRARLEGGVTGTLVRNDQCVAALDRAWRKAWVMGWPLRMEALYPQPAPEADLPAYPWNRQTIRTAPTPESEQWLHGAAAHPLLGWCRPGQDVWENTLDLSSHPWVKDHQVGESVFFPAAAYLEMALAAARETRPGWTPVELVNTTIYRPLIFREDAPLKLRTTVGAADGEVRILGRSFMRKEEWVTYARGRMVESHAPTPRPCDAVRDPESFGEALDAQALYALTTRANMHYGPEFRPVEALWRRGNTILARLALRTPPSAANAVPSGLSDTSGVAEGMLIPPPLLDGGLQLIFQLIDEDVRQRPAPRLPYWFERCTLFCPGVPVFALASLVRASQRTVTCSLDLLDAEGRVLLRLEEGRARLAERLAAPGTPRYYAQHLTPVPRAGETFALPAPDAAAAEARRLCAEWAASPQCRRHSEELVPLRHTAVLAMALECLEKIAGNTVLRPEEALAAGRWPQERQALLYHLLELLERHGAAQRVPQAPAPVGTDSKDSKDSTGDGWLLERPQWLPDFDDIWHTLLRDDPSGVVETQMLGRAAALLRQGGALPPVAEDVLHEQFYRFSPVLRRNNTLAAQAVRAWLKDCPEGARPHVLEAGAAPGGLFHALFQMLFRAQSPDMREGLCRYTVTDADATALEKMAGQTSVPPGGSVRFVPWRLGQALEGDAPGGIGTGAGAGTGMETDLEAGAAHCLVLGYCLHEADNVAAALAQCAHMLADGGLLVVAECAPGAFVDAVLGLRAPWWALSPAPQEPASRLLPPAAWRDALARAGFSHVQTLHASGGEEHEAEAFVLLARKEASVKVARAQTVQEEVAPEEAPSGERWFLLTDKPCALTGGETEGLPRHLGEELQAAGARVRTLSAGKRHFAGDAWRLRPASAADWAAFWEAVAAEAQIQPEQAVQAVQDVQPGIVIVDCLDVCGDTALDMDAAERHAVVLARLLQAWDKAGRPPLRWRLASCGVLSDSVLSGAEHAPAHAAVWGMARVAMNEMPALDIRCVDVAGVLAARSGGISLPTLARALCHELVHPDAEREILLRVATPEVQGENAQGAVLRYGTRVREEAAPSADTAENCPALRPSLRSSLRLSCRVPGHLETLAWLPVPQAQPAAGEVRVRVEATGLNFRDVMWAMGLLPEEALENGFSGAGLGIECAGVVEAVGPGVDGLSPDLSVGQRVVCFAPHCFGTHVLTLATATAPMPEQWSFAEAASVPVAFFTAWYALRHVANLQTGQSVLIHGAAGGVGLAALQVAAHMGLEVFATAGSEDKRRLLRAQGVQHVLDSRSYAFREQILDITGGRGVDAVLNSLAGEGMARSLDVVRPFGHFLELGKRDFFNDSPLRLRPFRNNISYHGIDVDQLIRERPELGHGLFREMMQLFAEGAWRPLPHMVFAGEDVENAFRTMQQSRHVGKIVVEAPSVSLAASPAISLAASSSAVESALSDPLRIRGDGAYVVTGGLGGFGLSTARWLAEQGAGALVLVGRGGPRTPEAREMVESLSAACTVRVAQADVANAASLHAALDAALRDLPPLRGVVHAAAVLDDATLARLTPAQLHRVLRPKARGAWNLHAHTQGERGKHLDFFIMYSSATTLMGNPGQGSYVAANMVMEGLAAWRRAQGLPALAVGWGAIADVGMLTRNAAALHSLRQMGGISATDSAQALAALPLLHRLGQPAPAALAADWKRLGRLPVGGSPRFGEVCPAGQFGDRAEGASLSLREAVEGKSRAEALPIITAAVTTAVAGILRVAPSTVRPALPLADMGMDSLMAVELGLALEELLGCAPPASSLSAGASVQDMAEVLWAFVNGEKSGGGHSPQAAGGEEGALRRQMEASHGVSVSDSFAEAVMRENGEKK